MLLLFAQTWRQPKFWLRLFAVTDHKVVRRHARLRNTICHQRSCSIRNLTRAPGGAVADPSGGLHRQIESNHMILHEKIKLIRSLSQERAVSPAKGKRLLLFDAVFFLTYPCLLRGKVSCLSMQPTTLQLQNASAPFLREQARSNPLCEPDATDQSLDR